MTRPLVGDFLRPVGTSTLRPSAGSCDWGNLRASLDDRVRGNGGSVGVGRMRVGRRRFVQRHDVRRRLGDDRQRERTGTRRDRRHHQDRRDLRGHEGAGRGQPQLRPRRPRGDLQGAVRRHQRQGRHQRSEDRADHRADRPVAARVERRGVPQTDRGRRRLPRHRVLPHHGRELPGRNPRHRDCRRWDDARPPDAGEGAVAHLGAGHGSTQGGRRRLREARRARRQGRCVRLRRRTRSR